MLRVIIRFYQSFISPMLGSACRFHPSCSQYTLEACEKHGMIRGSFLALFRIVKCGPWCRGGIDEVP